MATTLPAQQWSSDVKNDHDSEKHSARSEDAVDDDSSIKKQSGVRNVEAVTSTWDKKMLWTSFILLYLLCFADAILTSVQSNLDPWVTSEFKQHSMLGVVPIAATVVGGVTKLAIAKIIDIWGRVEGMAVMMFFLIVGLIMKATCVNVEMYAAAHIFYWTCHLGLRYVINIVIADMTTLQNRMIIFGINSTPTIASTFAGPAIAELFLERSNFRWAFGAFVFILLAFFIPVWVIFFLAYRKARASGIIQKVPSGRTKFESFKHYFVEFDVVGMFLSIAGFSLILLPFGIASRAPNGWASDYIIAMIVLGVVSLGSFAAWEKYFAKVPYFPWKFLTNRTILGASVLYGTMYISIFIWDAYYLSYLQVVHNLPPSSAGYVLNSFALSGAFMAPFAGLAIRYTNDYKWVGMAGLPFVGLGTALLVHFRRPDAEVGYLVMCQIFNGFGTGIWAACAQIAIMASVTHQEVAVAIALWGMFGSIGSSIGLAVAAAMWTNLAPGKLAQELPEGSKDLAAGLYADMRQQLAYPMGSPVRIAMIETYAYVQRLMVIGGSAFLPIFLVCILVWKRIDLKKRQEESGQSKGTLF